jgi:hypothetical protein
MVSGVESIADLLLVEVVMKTFLRVVMVSMMFVAFGVSVGCGGSTSGTTGSSKEKMKDEKPGDGMMKDDKMKSEGMMKDDKMKSEGMMKDDKMKGASGK